MLKNIMIQIAAPPSLFGACAVPKISAVQCINPEKSYREFLVNFFRALVNEVDYIYAIIPVV